MHALSSKLLQLLGLPYLSWHDVHNDADSHPLPYFAEKIAVHCRALQRCVAGPPTEVMNVISANNCFVPRAVLVACHLAGSRIVQLPLTLNPSFALSSTESTISSPKCLPCFPLLNCIHLSPSPFSLDCCQLSIHLRFHHWRAATQPYKKV